MNIPNSGDFIRFADDFGYAKAGAVYEVQRGLRPNDRIRLVNVVTLASTYEHPASFLRAHWVLA
jgi:hypothetical protein